MADAFTQEYRNIMLGGGINPGLVDLNDAGTTIKVGLRDEGALALDLVNHESLDDIDGAGVLLQSQTCATKTVGTAAQGAFDHDNVVFTSVTGASVESLDYYKDTGTPTTSPYLANIDSATGLPVTPNGGNINWNPAAGGVWQIT